jgi:hypothetical protein
MSRKIFKRLEFLCDILEVPSTLIEAPPSPLYPRDSVVIR